MDNITKKEEFIDIESVPSVDVLLSLKDNAISNHESVLSQISDIKNWSTYFAAYVTFVGYLILNGIEKQLNINVCPNSYGYLINVSLLFLSSIPFILSLVFFALSIRMKKTNTTIPTSYFNELLIFLAENKIKGDAAEKIALLFYIDEINEISGENLSYLSQKQSYHSQLIDYALLSTFFILIFQILYIFII